jgi:hypothetical protein
MLKRTLSILSYVLAVYVGGLLVSSTIAQRSPAGGGRRAPTAASNQTLLDVMSPDGLWRFPPFASDPTSCGAAQQGNTYYNTTSDEILVCDGTGPSYANSGITTTELNDLTDVAITSPSNNEILRYNSTSGDWENNAQSASALGDLSNVVLTTPSSTEILQFNGSNWVNAASSSATLSGLTDTTLTTPGDGDRLVHDGTDWKNEAPAGSSFYVFPTNWNGGAWTSNAVIGSANAVRVFRQNIGPGFDINRIIWRQVGDTSCDCMGVGLYSGDGNTLHTSATITTTTGINTTHNVDVTNFRVVPGEYYIGVTSDATGCTWYATASNATLDGVLNDQATFVGTSSNQSGLTDCALPSTLGTITANTNIYQPLVILEGQ